MSDGSVTTCPYKSKTWAHTGDLKKKCLQKYLVISRDYLVALAFLIKTFKVNEYALLKYHHFKSCLISQSAH